MTDYAHPMPPFEALPEPTAPAKPATWAPADLDVVSVIETAKTTYYRMTNDHTVREKKSNGVKWCLSCHSITSRCHFAASRYNDRRAAA